MSASARVPPVTVDASRNEQPTAASPVGLADEANDGGFGWCEARLADIRKIGRTNAVSDVSAPL